VQFDPASGGPTAFAEELEGWQNLPGFRTQTALKFHLLGSFMAEALIDQRRLSEETINKLTAQGLMPVDLTRFYGIRGAATLRMPEEQGFLALLD
jgi:hypothetical protein